MYFNIIPLNRLLNVVVISLLLLVLFFQNSAYSQTTPNKTGVVKGSIPSDPNYWNYTNWYKNNSVVSLIVSGEDKEHLIDALKQIKVLKEKNVLIGEILVVGGFSFGDLNNNIKGNTDLKNKISSNAGRLSPEALNFLNQIAAPSELPELAQKLNLGESTFAELAPIIAHYNISLSPSWIIRYKGQDHIYEGNFDITRFFTADGQFSALSYE